MSEAMPEVSDRRVSSAGALSPTLRNWSAPSLARNVILNWTSTGLMILSTLVLTPIIVGALEKELYGIWSFLNGLLVYTDLLYLGLGSALVRCAAEHLVRGAAYVSASPAACTLARLTNAQISMLGPVFLTLWVGEEFGGPARTGQAVLTGGAIVGLLVASLALLNTRYRSSAYPAIASKSAISALGALTVTAETYRGYRAGVVRFASISREFVERRIALRSHKEAAL